VWELNARPLPFTMKKSTIDINGDLVVVIIVIATLVISFVMGMFRVLG